MQDSETTSFVSSGPNWPCSPAWFQAPRERTPRFLPTYASISLALQTALREHVAGAVLGFNNDGCDRLNAVHLSDVDMAYPLIVYLCSAPFHAKPRTDFTYDVLNTKAMARLFRSARKPLPITLESLAACIQAKGLTELAPWYAPEIAEKLLQRVQTKKTCRNYLTGLLTAESGLMNELLRFSEPVKWTERTQARAFARLDKGWNRWLRRLYAGYDLTFLGGRLLEAATRALEQAQAEKPYP